MKRTPETSEAGLENWFFTHPAYFDAPAPKERSRILSYIWPAGLDYPSTIPGLYLCEEDSAEKIKKNGHWIVRDGLVSLLWYFRSRPTPSSSQPKLFFHEEFAGVIPRAWRKSSGLYRHVSLSPNAKKPKKLLLLSVVMDTFCSLKDLERQLTIIKKEVDKKSISEIAGFLPPKVDYFGNDKKVEFYAEFYFRMCEYLGTQIKVMRWSEFEDMPSFEDFYFYELNSKFLCSDNYLVQSAMSRKARHLVDSDAELWPGERLIKLSPYHGLAIRDKIDAPYYLDSKDEALVQKGYEQISAALSSPASHRIPWPSWFKVWSEKVFDDILARNDISKMR